MLFMMPKSLIKAIAVDGIGDDDLLSKPKTGAEALPLIFFSLVELFCTQKPQPQHNVHADATTKSSNYNSFMSN